MADYMDQEAVESSDEDDLSEEDNRSKAKSPSLSKKRHQKVISSDEEEEDEDEEKAREEMKGFIAVRQYTHFLLGIKPDNIYCYMKSFNKRIID